MTHTQVRARAAVMFAVIAAVLPALARQADPAPFMRSVEARDGQRVQLEMAIRRLVPDDPARPTIYLVGAVHVADRPFYERLQEFLDARDVVLFEGVKPPGAGSGEHDDAIDDADRARITSRRLRFLAGAAEMYRAGQRRYPDALADLPAGVEKRFADLVRGALDDAWGRAIAYEVRDGDFVLTSLGADGRPGGQGADADVVYDTAIDGRIRIPTSDDGIQTRLARGLGLVFQLDAMDHNRSNWRNSDLSMDQVMDRLDASGHSGDALFGALAGESFGVRVAGVLLNVMRFFPSAQALVKVMLIELLQNADDVIAAVPGEMAAMMDVLIHDRNDVVIADLQRVLEHEPAVREVAIIYGAGHLPDLQRRITAELGYTPGEDAWIPAIRVDLDELGMRAEEVERLRNLIRTTIDRQLRMMERQMQQEQRRRTR